MTSREAQHNGVVPQYTPLMFDMARHHDVCIAHVEPDGTFYCQLMKNARNLDRLMCELQEVPRTPLTNPQNSMPCLVESQHDGLLYRGKVISLTGRTVQVKFVDFGLQETVPSTSIFLLEENYCSLAAQAFKSTLDGVEKLLESNVCDSVRTYESKVPLVAKVLFRTVHSYQLELTDTSDENDTLVADVVKTSSPAKGKQQAVSKLSPKTSSVSIPPAEVRVGAEEKLFVTAILSDETFFGQLAKYSQETLDEMQGALQDHYGASSKSPLQNPSVGDFCCTEFTEDGQFYRSKILKAKPASEKYLVSFVDYGNCEAKKGADLRSLVVHFSSLPQQGITCSLSSCYSGLAKSILEENLLEREIIVKLDSSGDGCYQINFPKVQENEEVHSVLQK